MSKEKNSVPVIKVTLGSGKEVYLKPPKIKDKNLATHAASSKAKDNPIAFMSAFQDELLKVLLIKIDGKDLTGAEKEDLDSILEFSEYTQLQSVIQKITGGDEGNAPQIEHATFGG